MVESDVPEKLSQNQIEDRILQLESRLERIQRFKNAENQKQKAQKRHFYGKKFRSKSTEINNKNQNNNLYLLKSNGYANPQNSTKISRQMFFSRSRPNLWTAKRKEGDYSAVSPLYSNDEAKPNMRHNLFSQMETGQYFWDTSARTNFGNHLEANYRHEDYFLPLNNQIPVSGDVLLESDIPGMDKKLDEIRQNLTRLKEFGLNSSSKNYYRYNSSNQNYNNQLNGQQMTNTNGTPSLASIRARICNIEFYMEKRIREILNGHNNLSHQRLSSNRLINNSNDKIVANADTILKEQTISMPVLTFDSKIKNVVNPDNQRSNFAMANNNTAMPLETIQKTENVLTEIPKKNFLFAESTNAFGKNNQALKVESNKNDKDNRIEDIGKSANSVNTAINESQTKTPDFGITAMNPINNKSNSENYDRMLEMLKRPEYQISTSSSSDEDEYYGTKIVGNSKSVNPSTNPNLSQQQQSIPLSTQFNSTVKQPSTENISKFQTTVDKDSDSDFFN